ncbi:MAG TPA: efflux RND transporter periplasmic adaptor subunit [Gemmatimonadales bacterium]|nr:efflux RND transporter periplasmic adaptor subunit [Gemmatimonadales bacterium]
MKRTLLLAALPLALAACKKADPAPVYEKVAVARRDITVSASAAGAIQPILTVQVKSQASGAVTEMKVQTGEEVRPGQLLAVIDPRLPKSAFDQAQASVDQAQAQYDYARAQLAREDTLFHANAVTEQEYQSSRVSFEQAKTSLVNAKANLSDARIAYEQTRVTAPLAGTIITKTVDIGTVISSPTHDVTGGTAMFTMANLDTVQVQALVDETDIGKVQPGMPVTITVDAYPNRPFNGSVLKIEPQATVNQNVTMFAVDVNIINPGHLLKPGMNTEVAVHIGDRTNVLAIPNAALRTPRDVASAATVLGLDPNAVQQQLAQAPAIRDSAKGQASLGGNTAKPDSGKGNTITFTGRDGTPQTITLPAGVTAEEFNAARAKFGSGQPLTTREQAIMAQLRSQFMRGQPGGGAGGGGRGGRSNDFGGNYIVFVLRKGQPAAVNIRTGLTDLDQTEVVSGLTEQDTVLVLPSASLVQAQKDFQNRFKSMTGGGLPGLQQAPSKSGSGNQVIVR